MPTPNDAIEPASRPLAPASAASFAEIDAPSPPARRRPVSSVAFALERTLPGRNHCYDAPMAETLALTEVARLDVAAASGLVRMDGRLYVVADDELDLCVFDDAGRLVERLPLFDGALADEHHARKASKPDLEALALLRPGLLLAVPSGSTAARCRGAAVRGPTVAAVDFAPLYGALARELDDLNIEAAAAAGDRLTLLQRGNGAAGHNAVITLDREAVCAAIAAGAPLSPSLLRGISTVRLGLLDGARLGFTDASPLPDGRLLFTAAAEAGGSTYEDGAALGSVVGLLDGDVVCGQVRLATRDKVEGLHADADGDLLTLHLVTDADDRARSATLYRATLSYARLLGA
ncbi:MAG: hypothetical protein JWN44_6351 [Myxococcales bacterium]|nr:hypothetical protein [Myxococcales bacterium]